MTHPGTPTPDIIAALRRRAEDAPGAVFCHFRARGVETTLTNAELLAGASRYAAMFAAGGVAEGQQVAIVLKHSVDLYHAFLGAMLHGCVPSFMPHPSNRQDPQVYWRNHRDVFEQTDIKVALTYSENADQLRARFPQLRVFAPSDAPATAAAADRAIDAQSTAFIQYSSGTTGLKKGVALSHAAVCEQIQTYSAALELRADDVIVSWLPLYHDMGLIACFMLPLLTGAPLVSLDAFEWVVQPSLLLSAMADSSRLG